MFSSDRTNEFLSLARDLPGAPPPSAAALNGGTSRNRPGVTSLTANAEASNSSSNSNSSKNHPPAFAELRTFHKTAADISKDIASTSAMLQELTSLVRHKTLLFQDDEDSMKVNSLVVRIKSNIENLNSRLETAGRTIAQQKRALGSQYAQAGQEAANVVDGLKQEFAAAAGTFKQVLQQRTDHMKESQTLVRQVYSSSNNSNSSGGAHSKSKKNGGGIHDDDMPPIPNLSTLQPPHVYGHADSFPSLDLTSSLMAAGEATGSSNSLLPRPHGIVGDHGMRNRRVGADGTVVGGPLYSSYSAPSSYGAPGTILSPYDIQRMEQEQNNNGSMQQQQQHQLIPDHTYLQSRADAMSTVESNIVELGTIFNKLAVMVSEHAELVQRVEDNVEEANSNINLSLAALTDTLTSLRSGKFLALKLFSILILFIAVFIIFFA